MEALILKALAKDPNDRFDDAMEMFQALVGREREIMAERDLTSKDTYFPGSELTGMHQVGKLQEYLAAATKAAQSGQAAGGAHLTPPNPSANFTTPTPAPAHNNHKLMIIAIVVLTLILIIMIAAILISVLSP